MIQHDPSIWLNVSMPYDLGCVYRETGLDSDTNVIRCLSKQKPSSFEVWWTCQGWRRFSFSNSVCNSIHQSYEAAKLQSVKADIGMIFTAWLKCLSSMFFKLNCEFSPGVCLDTDAASIWHHLTNLIDSRWFKFHVIFAYIYIYIRKFI